MKKVFLLLTLVFLSGLTFAQSWKEFKDSINYYYEKGDVSKAAGTAEKAIAQIRKQQGENHPDHLAAVSLLINIYYNTGDHQKAMRWTEVQLDLIKKIKGEEDPDYINCLSNLGNLYTSAGQYALAEPLLVQALNTRKKLLGEEHADYAISLNNLGIFYLHIANYEAAKPLLEQNVLVRKKVYGEESAEYATGLNSLAGLYENMGDMDKARSYYIQTMTIQRRVLGGSHPDYARTLSNLAAVQEFLGNYTVAESLYKKSLDILKTTQYEENSIYPVVLSNLAVLYQNMGNYDGAESLILESLSIRKRVWGDEDPDLSIAMSNLATLYQCKGDHTKALQYSSEAERLVFRSMEINFIILSEKEKLAWWENERGNFQLTPSFLYSGASSRQPFLIQAYDHQLRLNGFVLNDKMKIVRAVRKSSNAQLQQLMNEWEESKTGLAKQYGLPVAARSGDLKKLESDANELEKKISVQSSLFRSVQENEQVGFGKVKEKLAPGEIAIEFVRFNYYNTNWTDSILYAAYVLLSNDPTPHFIPICEERQLTKYFSSSAGTAGIKAIYRSEVEDETKSNVTLGDSLYAVVWKPLLPYLKGIKKIHYSPAGLLNRIAFHALPVSDSQILLDKYEMNRYVSTRQLATRGEEAKTISRSITLFGDAAFATGEPLATTKSSTPATASAGGGASWVRLAGTEKEIATIRSLFEKNKIKATSLSQEKATEEEFKSLSGHSPEIIHLATHGFFLSDPGKKKKEGVTADKRNAFTMADDPMLRSGIVLAGANKVWSGQLPAEGMEDGIVTAYEIAQLDLGNTDLVVLSACETALGDIKGTEGVFGLQRAFKLAGVKSMMLSLWKVPDAETAELMTAFYTYYLAGKPAREALNNAQKDMRKKYKPYYWAAFVLIE